MTASVSQADGRQRRTSRRSRLCPGRPRVLGREGDVLLGGQGRDQVERLEHEPHGAGADPGAIAVRQAGGIGAVDPELGRRPVVGVRAVEQPEEVHQGALAGPGRPHDRDHLASLDRHVDATQGIDGRPPRKAICLAEIGCFDHVHRGLHHS